MMQIGMGMDQAFRKAVEEKVRGYLAFSEPMAAHTWLRVGGPADVYVRPKDEADLISLVKWLAVEKVAYLVVGAGSNLLVTDKGVRGVVIDTSHCLKGLSLGSEGLRPGEDRVEIRAMAGERLTRLCRYAIENSLEGLVFATGIPGSVGGAIFMNAGAAGRSMSEVVRAVRLLFSDGRVETFLRYELSFAYRGLNLPGSEDALHPPVIIEACFELSPANREDLEKEADLRTRERWRGQPTGASSAGCIFKNPENAGPAGWMIEQAGMKGRELGGAQVSEKHANFIINRGHASAADILRLMESVQKAVYERFHIWLEPEVKIVGE